MLRGVPDGSVGELRSFHSQPVEQNRRILLFIAQPGSVSNALAAAVEREFEWISVRSMPDLAMARTTFGGPVQLILVDAAQLDQLKVLGPAIAKAHPAASIAVTVSHCGMCAEAHRRTAAERKIRGIVPMDVNLDIWLSVMRIMLNGGEYFPPQLVHCNTAELPLPIKEPEPKPPGPPTIVRGLTTRELQVLSCVARGLQNKNIAAELGLSEHTVKIHIHNIIRKLGAHNRTEAAALYFRRTSEMGVLQTTSSEVPV